MIAEAARREDEATRKKTLGIDHWINDVPYEQALEMLASGQNVSLVFSDVVLPGQLDGLALARIVNERYPAIPVVLTTGYTKVFDTDPEFPVLRKPYQATALGRVIHDALDPAKN